VAGWVGSDEIESILEDARRELVRPVPDTLAQQHLTAMFAVAPTRVAAPAPTRRARSIAWGPRRALAFVAAIGATFTYGGLAAAGALPAAIDVPHQIHELFGGDAHRPAVTSPTTDAAVPGKARERALPSPAGGHRRASVAAATSHAPGGGVRPGSSTTTTLAPGASDAAPGHGTTPPGDGGVAPGQTDTTPGSTGNANENDNGDAPGASITTPADGTTTPGHGGAQPGLSVAPDPNTNANSNANGNSNANAGNAGDPPAKSGGSHASATGQDKGEAGNDAGNHT
jgi:hypothetical protein